MSPICIRLSFALLIFSQTRILAQSFDMQSETAFLKHLRTEKLYYERQFLLNHAKSSRIHLLQLEKAWNYSATVNYDSALFWYSKTDFDSILHYKFATPYLKLLFKVQRFNELAELVKKMSAKDSTSQTLIQSISMMNLKLPPSFEVPSALLDPYRNYSKMKRKSLFVAGLYSSIIPGAGKVYYGQKRQGLNIFLVNAAFAAQTYEWYRKAGLKSPGFYIFGGVFSVFYISNIYGTVIGLKKARTDRKHQLHHEIINHYFSIGDPYPGQY
jgi:hypothetical protein